MTETCSICRFWKPGDLGEGACVRYPPQLYNAVTFVWPVTEKDQWCGEFMVNKENFAEWSKDK